MAGATAVQPAPASAIEVGVGKLLEQYRQQFESALPRHMRIDHFMRCALTYIKKNPEVGKCTPVSICKALMDAAQLGLAPDGLLGSAYLVPFNNKVKGRDGGQDSWEKQCQLIPGYRGLIDLARRSGEILDIQARPVLVGEEFDIDWGRTPPLKHRPNLDANPASGNGDQVRGVYAIAFFKDGSQHLEYMSRGEIMGIQARSKANGKGFSPWQTDWVEMARKTAVKRLAKYLPLSPELSRAIDIDNDAERVVETAAVAVEEAPATKTEALKRRLKHEPQPDLEAEVAAAAEEREANDAEAIPAGADGLDDSGHATAATGQPAASAPAPEAKKGKRTRAKPTLAEVFNINLTEAGKTLADAATALDFTEARLVECLEHGVKFGMGDLNKLEGLGISIADIRKWQAEN